MRIPSSRASSKYDAILSSSPPISLVISAAVEIDRVMRLEPGGLDGDDRVGGGVALVEAVAGELLHRVEDAGARSACRCRAAAQPATKRRAPWPSPRLFSCPSRGAAGRRRRACSRASTCATCITCS